MNDLSQRLAHEADQFTRRGGTELELSQVLERAGEIRRGRRMRATMLMAACVLAIAVPTALLATQRDTTHEPSPAPAPKIDITPLGLQGLKTGATPKSGWVQGSVWHAPDGHEVTWSGGRVTAVAPVGKATLLAVSEADGEHARLLPPVGDKAQAVTSWPMEGGFALSPDGSLAAFMKPDGTPFTVGDSGGVADALPRIPRGTGFDAVAVAGKSCDQSAADGGCAVWVNSRGRNPEAWVSSLDGLTGHPGGSFMGVADVVPGRYVAGYTSVSDSGSCSAVADMEGTQQWSTCDHRLLAFSPDGRRLLGSAAYADGMGDTGLVVLDVATGEPALDLHATDGAAITQMVWEDDTHILATVYDANQWGVVRIGLDGKRELALAPVRDNGDLASPFVLATR